MVLRILHFEIAAVDPISFAGYRGVIENLNLRCESPIQGISYNAHTRASFQPREPMAIVISDFIRAL